MELYRHMIFKTLPNADFVLDLAPSFWIKVGEEFGIEMKAKKLKKDNQKSS